LGTVALSGRRSSLVRVVPGMAAHGFTEAEVAAILVETPARALAVRG
jgi:predicted metal-dependent phosphotriesterase family hydrolase